MHLPRTIADFIPDGFIWTPFCEDLDQATWTIENTAFALDPNWSLIGSQNAGTPLKQKKTQHLLGS